MSLGKDIQRAETKIKALEAQVQADDAAKSALMQEIEKMKTEQAEAVKVAAEAAAATQAEAAKVKTELEAQVKAASDKAVALEAELAKAHQEIKDAQAKLAHPAFADAAGQGEAKAVEAAPEPQSAPVASLYAQYSAIEDPIARSIFWNKNEKALREEARAMANK